LRPSRRLPNCNRSVEALGLGRLAKRLPALEGRAIRIRFLPDLRAGRDKLYSQRPYGQPVYAASFIRRRSIVLDQELKQRPRELARILVHELFHFVWVRLGNPARSSYLALLQKEWKRHARGELGWSAEMRKSRLRGGRRSGNRAKQWRDYACESFCDTAAWLYSGLGKHPELTLAARYRTPRVEWFRGMFPGPGIPI